MEEQKRGSEIIFIGSGPSGLIPRVSCLTEPLKEDGRRRCKVCEDAYLNHNSKNRRGNTSLLIRYAHPDGNFRNILIDCGKSFRDGALNSLVKNGIRQIDAVLLTHDHADAMMGMDDLRDFTHHTGERKSMPIFLRGRDLESVARVFPYLVDTKKSTGSGYVADLKFITIDGVSPFEVEGLKITPLLVHHGFVGNEPYTSMGFKFGNVVYISDISNIPEETKKMMRDENVDIMILDGINYSEELERVSHLSIQRTVEYFQEFKPSKGFLVGMNHEVDHDATNAKLRVLKDPPDMLDISCAYDGLVWPVSL